MKAEEKAPHTCSQFGDGDSKVYAAEHRGPPESPGLFPARAHLASPTGTVPGAVSPES